MWPEGKYATLSSEALWVHHIQSRRLYGQIQRALYGATRRSGEDREGTGQEVVSDYMQQVQEWYMKSRFNSTVIPFSEESVKRHVSTPDPESFLSLTWVGPRRHPVPSNGHSTPSAFFAVPRDIVHFRRNLVPISHSFGWLVPSRSVSETTQHTLGQLAPGFHFVRNSRLLFATASDA